MSQQSETELEVLESILPELEADGYEVYIRPNRPLVPKFLETFQPDAIAKRSDSNLVIEVALRSPESKKKVEQITKLFERQRSLGEIPEKWRLRIVSVSPASISVKPAVQQVSAIKKRIKKIEELQSQGHLEASLLLCWATFEALGRALQPEKFERAQTPRRLVEVLAGEGYLSPLEADHLRTLANKRNGIVHGSFQIKLSNSDISNFLKILKALQKVLNSVVQNPTPGE